MCVYCFIFSSSKIFERKNIFFFVRNRRKCIFRDFSIKKSWEYYGEKCWAWKQPIFPYLGKKTYRIFF